MKITWLPSFETGIADIDNEHRKLIKAIQEIESALAANDLDTCARLFPEFLKQAAEHFAKEEVLLESISFPRVETHRAAHMRLLEMGDNTLQIVEAGLDHEGAVKCLEEVIYFLLEDVIKADAEFKSHAQEKGLI